MSILSIAAIQLNSTASDNLAVMEQQLKLAKLMYPATQLVMFSELCAFSSSPLNAQPMPGPAEETFCRWARENEVWLIPGSIFEKTSEGVYNTSSVIDPSGKVVARYRKIYPFLPHEEGVLSGKDYVTFDVPGIGKGGVSICYDSWFPETTRTLSWLGAEFILHPTMTRTIDRDAELAIVRASAITNQCWFVDINGAGGLGAGRSIVVGPEGDVYHEASNGTEIIPVEIDLGRVRRTRESGLLGGLGQPLKSFRDGPQSFPVYAAGPNTSPTLKSLGKLEKKAEKSE